MFDHDLVELKLFQNRAFIDGNWVGDDCTNRQVIYNPATGDPIGDVPMYGEVEARWAVDAAARAFSSWRNTTGHERQAILLKWASLLREYQDGLAQITVLEAGKPLKEALGEVTYAASFFDWFAGEAVRTYGDTIPAAQADRRIIVSKEPAGVTAAITPWNFPLACVVRKIAPALAAGCTQVLKPAPETPFTSLAIAQLGQLAGVPSGVLNVITGDAPAIGRVLTSHPDVRVVSFTGSTPVGKLLAEQCGRHVKRAALELGGNAAFIVFEDADIDAAIDEVIASKFRNAGQTCVCANRIFVDEKIADVFSVGLAKRVSEFEVGDGAEKTTDIGPLINAAAIQKVESHIEDALDKGAALIVGGKALDRDGYFHEPTVLDYVTEEMTMAHEEIFGPVAPVYRFSSEREVIERANATPYGLSAYLYTNELSRALRVSKAIDSGMVGVNTGLLSNEVSPFGGVKESGLGREGSKYGIDEFLEIKSVQIKVSSDNMDER